jgi:hypothetical protein
MGVKNDACRNRALVLVLVAWACVATGYSSLQSSLGLCSPMNDTYGNVDCSVFLLHQ